MRKLTLPGDLRAEWIWLTAPLPKKESYVFFRKEITLGETPALAELWITARTFFHLYVNGRHVSYGPPTYPLATHCYVCCFDIGYLLETGLNVIGVLAHNTSVARFSSRRQDSGFWAQLNLDGQPSVWTNSSWQALAGECYAENRPRRSLASGFTEKTDFRFFPTGWINKEYNAGRWRHPDWRQPLKPEDTKTLIPLTTPEFTSFPQPAEGLAARGRCGPVLASTHVSFQSLVHDGGAGVYAAETFLHLESAKELDVQVFCDNPYRVLCNGRCVKEQGVVTLPAGIDKELATTLYSRVTEPAPLEGKIAFKAGWNQLVFCQQMDYGSSGFTLVFPGVQLDGMQFLRAQGGANPGWSLVGPLRAPLANITGSLQLGDLNKLPFDPALISPVNEAAHLMSYEFQPHSLPRKEIPETADLRQGEYWVLDFGQSYYGCPAFTVRGTDRDVLDVICGERLSGEQFLPFEGGWQNVDSMTLGPDTNDWMAYAPRGFRYVMLLARNAANVIRVSNIQVCRRKYAVENTGELECADTVLTQIWATGSRTLEVTIQDAIMDSACKENAQYIPDSMIQALATYHVFGNYELGAKAITEFAEAQIETGEMPAACPSDSYVNIPDYALLWPVWLQRHYLYSGDEAFLQSMLPTLEKLLSYFAFVADEDTELLRALDVRFGAPCFLDHGDMDRDGIVTGLNALYCRALLSAASIMEQIGRDEPAALWRERALHVAQQVRHLTWIPERGVFADSWADGVRSDSCTWQTNVLALYGGLAQADEYAGIFNQFFSQESPYCRFPPEDTENPYFHLFVLETALALGYREWALNMIRWYWGGMLRHGAVTWWEFFNPRAAADAVPGGSLCHGYGVYPNIFLPTELAGVRPAAPGFTRIYFNPILGVSWVKAEIPTPHGRISVSWRMRGGGELEVTINANYPLEVIPLLEPEVSASAIFHVGDGVSILAMDGGDDAAAADAG